MKIKLWLILLLPFLISAGSSNTRVKFIKGNLTMAKAKAAEEGKLYFVDFYASWCMPCRWMDETTFSDQRLAEYIHQNYIPVKVDIDDFDGYAYKQLYNIKMLPSILIFSSQGKLLAQFEESMAPSKMLKILQQYNLPKNRIGQKAQQSTAVQSPGPREPHQPQVPVVDAPAKVNPPPAYAQSSMAKPVEPRPAAPPKPQISRPAKPSAAPGDFGQGLYRFKVSRQSTQGFSVQIGAFREYGNVLREATKLEAAFNHPVIVHITLYQGQPVYKVMVGEFSGRKQATQLKDEMARKGIPGLIKDLSTIG
ncbi:MAG: thioredoxin family protein [Bacteroidota bacterium]